MKRPDPVLKRFRGGGGLLGLMLCLAILCGCGKTGGDNPPTPPQNPVHISYFDSTNGNLKYATNTSGVWDIQTPDGSPAVGSYTSIVLDPSNQAYISYHDTGDSSLKPSLKYATNASGAWSFTTVDGGAGADVGWFTSIAVDALGNASISYYDFTDGDLKYATNASGSWLPPTIVDSPGDVGQYSSLALDASGKAHISYYDGSNKALKYATNASGTWSFTTVDSLSNGYVGWYTSLALDSSDNPHISYYDRTNGDLKYATCASNCTIPGNWIITTVDSQGDVGWYSSLAVDVSGNAHISYYDATNGVLKYATNDSGGWVVTTVDSTGDVGWFSSIAVE